MFLFKMLIIGHKNKIKRKEVHLEFSRALTKGFSLIVREGILEGVFYLKKKKGKMYFTVGLLIKMESAKSKTEERLSFWFVLQH